MVSKAKERAENRALYEEAKKKDIASFVDKDKIVDWFRWKQQRLEAHEGSYLEDIVDGLPGYLVEIGILSITPEGNHGVRGSGGLNLNPKVSRMVETYFTSREQARFYVNAVLSGAHYGVRIERLNDIEHIK